MTFDQKDTCWRRRVDGAARLRAPVGRSLWRAGAFSATRAFFRLAACARHVRLLGVRVDAAHTPFNYSAPSRSRRGRILRACFLLNGGIAPVPKGL